MKAIFFILFLMFSVTAFAENDAIRVLHTKVIRVKEGEDVNIKANIINSHKLNYSILHYKNINDKTWSEKEMKPADGFYVSIISSKEMGKVGLVYYIEVVDIEGKSIEAFGSKENPQYIDIIEGERKNDFISKAKNDSNNNIENSKKMEDEFAIFIEEDDEAVITASKYSQTRSSAPANISVVTQKDIIDNQYHSLIEILRDNGFDINDNGSWPDIGLRGINDRTTYGKYLLVFIDGHNMSFTQFYRNIIFNGLISLEDIQKIEIQKGPGSSIWGANALQGVINIVTKNYKSRNAATIITGTHNTFSSHARITQNINKNISLLASVMSFSDDRSKDMVIKEWSDVKGEDVNVDNMTQNSYTFFGKLKLWDFTITSYFNRYDPYAPISTFSIGGDDTRFVTDRFYNVLNYDKEFINNKDLSFSLSTTISHDRYKFAYGAQYENKPYLDEPTRFTEKMEAKDDRFEGKMYTTIGIKKINTTLLAGFDYEYLDTLRWYYPQVFAAENITKPEYTQNNIGAFLQAELNLFKMVSLVGGFRYDKNSIYEPQFSPKASLVITPGDFFFKAIWGQGFKAPSLHELYYFRKGAYYGNPLLDSETSNSIEAQIGYNKKDFLDIELTFFKTGMSNVISYQKNTYYYGEESLKDFDDSSEFPTSQLPTSVTDDLYDTEGNPIGKSYNQQDNNGEYQTIGVELFTKITFMKSLYITLRGGYNKVEKSVKGEFIRLEYGQEYFAFFGINYKLFKKYNFNISGRYTSDKLVASKNFGTVDHPSDLGNTSEIDNSDSTLSTDAYFVLNFAFFTENLFIQGFNLGLKVDNILNQRYYDAGREVLYPQTGTRIWGTLQYKF